MASLHPLPPKRSTRLRDLLSKLLKLTVTFPQNLETFTSFPKLPIELRFKIWCYASCEPRFFTLEHSWAFSPGDPSFLEGRNIDGKNKVPALLHTCVEARLEGLKHYTACTKRCDIEDDIHDAFGHVSTLVPCPNKKVYVNFNVDRFILPGPFECHVSDDCYWDEYQLEKDLARIQLLDILWEDDNIKEASELELLHTAKELKELNFVVSSYCWAPKHDMDDYIPNTVGGELCMLEDGNIMVADLEMRTGENAEGGKILRKVSLGCKWTTIPEEMDLFPISAGATETYATAGGCDESILSWDRERRLKKET